MNKSKTGKTVLFAGTFDPFTKGHKSVVDRSLLLFDNVVIAVGVNPDKCTMYPVNFRIEYIKKVYESEPRVRVECYTGLTTDFAKELGVDALVRGVRTNKDFEYEREMADINHQLSGIETVLLFTEPLYSALSSSIVRELIHHGKNVDNYLPLPISSIKNK